MTKKIVLITACGSKKENFPTLAGQLYKSSRIRYLYKISQQLDIDFYILSARYGLVSSKTLIEPYDKILTKKRCEELKKHMVEIIKKFDTVIFYKGGSKLEYSECIESICKILNKEFISFGYGNMGDINKIFNIMEQLNEKYK